MNGTESRTICMDQIEQAVNEHSDRMAAMGKSSNAIEKLGILEWCKMAVIEGGIGYNLESRVLPEIQRLTDRITTVENLTLRD